MRKPHPDSKLTLPEAFEKHYHKDEIERTTLKTFRYVLNAWERTVGKVAIGQIDNATVTKFRDELHTLGRTARTVNGYWYVVRTILRLLAPPYDRNPQGLGIIKGPVPYVRPLKEVRGMPRRVSLDELDKFYLHCYVAKFPRGAFSPAEFWRLLVVMAYATALRKSDLLGIRTADLDMDAGTLTVIARKTAKPARFPLHAAAIVHIKRTWSDREFLFPQRNMRNGQYNQRWHEIRNGAGVEHFTLHDVRRTAASEAERARHGFGGILLQHREADRRQVSMKT